MNKENKLYIYDEILYIRQKWMEVKDWQASPVKGQTVNMLDVMSGMSHILFCLFSQHFKKNVKTILSL